uniref:Uncharacterized protein LOC104245948 isoform X1 n=1 Tax=Nicotiana sylvestris TaxID=4096 RepID=A0A1U7YA36_NICSY|nr:PREDICTED: uncharacterized protein LOC104245948 isoform X1 [Nicotiana sylvestris]
MCYDFVIIFRGESLLLFLKRWISWGFEEKEDQRFIFVTRCECGKRCMVHDCWEEAGRRYWACMNKFYRQPDEPICNFEVWIDEPCEQEYYKDKLYSLHSLCLKQWEREQQSKQEAAELKVKLKEVEEEKNKLEDQLK